MRMLKLHKLVIKFCLQISWMDLADLSDDGKLMLHIEGKRLVSSSAIAG